MVREAEEYLETVAARLREDGVPGVRTSVWYGAAAPAILEAARMANPDLIMMSTHGRSGIGRLDCRVGGRIRAAGHTDADLPDPDRRHACGELRRAGERS